MLHMHYFLFYQPYCFIKRISNKRTLCLERIHFLLTVFFFILVCTIFSISRNENVVDRKNKHTVYLIERNE